MASDLEAIRAKVAWHEPKTPAESLMLSDFKILLAEIDRLLRIETDILDILLTSKTGRAILPRKGD